MNYNNLIAITPAKDNIMLNRKNLLPAALLLLALQLAACQTLPLNEKLPDNLAAEKITVVDENSPFAVTPDGNVVALSSSGLKLFHIPTKEHVPLSAKTPRRLAWSPFGTTLAALFSEGQKSRVITYDQQGYPLAETVIDAPLTELGWLSEQELALGGAVIKQYKFGSNYRSMLYRWQSGKNAPVASELRDSTLQPATLSKWQAYLERGPLMDFSSQTPLISYLHPVEPPVFSPYYKVVIKDLASGRETEVAAVSLTSQGAKLSADGEKILFGDGQGSTSLRNPWSEEELCKAGSPGFQSALSPEPCIWFADGALFRGGNSFTPLAPGATAQFTADGSRLLLQAGTELYLLTGLKPVAGAMFIPALNEKLQKLRSLKLEGLVSPQEYKEALERIVQP